jgi:hypothetical protein
MEAIQEQFQSSNHFNNQEKKSPDAIQMTVVSEIKINQAILHVVDNTKDGKLELSDLPLDITPEKVNHFLRKHILDSLKDDKIKKAKFNLTPTNVVKNSCTAIIEDTKLEEVFVENSRLLAQNLYKYMTRGSISPGCLIICKYFDEKNNPCVSIMKMDYNEYYVHSSSKVGNKVRNNLIPQTNGLPSIKQKLQKCAFIKEYKAENSYDLIVLDKQQQQANKQEEEVAQFFYKYFLDCAFCKDIRSNTKNFITKSCAFIKEMYSDDPVKAKEKINLLQQTMRSAETFNANTFAEIAFSESEDIKEKYLEEVIKKNDLVYESQIDKDYVEKKFTKIVFSSDEGIEISLDSAIMEDKNTFLMEESKEVQGTYNIFIKNIHVTGKDIKFKNKNK